MKTFQISGILLTCIYILHNEGYEAEASLRHAGRHGHGKNRNVVAQQDYPKSDDLLSNYVAVAKLKGYITKKLKKVPSGTIKKNVAALPTEDKLEYSFFPSYFGAVQFKLRADNGVYITLSRSAADRDPMYEVFIGGWSDTRLANRENRTEPVVAGSKIPGILNGDEFRGFWVRWNNGTISGGNEGNSTPFLTYTESERLKIEYVGVRTGWRASGWWIIEQGEGGRWIAANAGNVPPGAYPGGEMNGEPMFIIRANSSGGLIPGYLVSDRTSFMTWHKEDDSNISDESSSELNVNSYEVLCDFGGNWKLCFGVAIPSNAVVAGQTSDGEPLYVGRVKHEGSLIVGKVQADYGLCFITYEGKQISFAIYEILIS